MWIGKKEERCAQGLVSFWFFPCKILAIFKCPRDWGSIKLVVHPCTYSNHEDNSYLVECWELDYESKRVIVPDLLTVEGNILYRVQILVVEGPKLVVVETSLVKEHIYVVEEMPGFKGYIQKNHFKL
jgi:hypothetical protein